MPLSVRAIVCAMSTPFERVTTMLLNDPTSIQPSDSGARIRAHDPSLFRCPPGDLGTLIEMEKPTWPIVSRRQFLAGSMATGAIALIGTPRLPRRNAPVSANEKGATTQSSYGAVRLP